MRVTAYINYKGTCEAAFRFYEQHLGARVLMMMKHGQQPNTSNVPPGWENAVLHARLRIGGLEVMGADIPQAEPMRSSYLTLLADSADDAERFYALLSEGGEVFMQLERDTFFASRFAMVRDRFGTSWMILHEQPSQTAASAGPEAGLPTRGQEDRAQSGKESCEKEREEGGQEDREERRQEDRSPTLAGEPAPRPLVGGTDTVFPPGPAALEKTQKPLGKPTFLAFS